MTAPESTPWTRTLAELLRLALRQNVGLRDDLNDLVTLLRAHDDKHSPYALACRDIAVLLHDVLEKHR